MRPGQLTPENDCLRRNHDEIRESFNEAGAINPGKLEGVENSIVFTNMLQ